MPPELVERKLAAILPAERRVDFRVGVHVGDVATEGGRIYGDGVNIAARLERLAEAGGICISATVHEQVRNKVDAGFTDLGDQTVKNIPDSVRVALAAMYGLEDAPERVRAEVAEMLRVKPDFTLDGAMELLAWIDQTMSPDELAKLPDLFRAAGLPRCRRGNAQRRGINGTPGGIRTPDPQVRSLMLYPAELPARARDRGVDTGGEMGAPAR